MNSDGRNSILEAQMGFAGGQGGTGEVVQGGDSQMHACLWVQGQDAGFWVAHHQRLFQEGVSHLHAPICTQLSTHAQGERLITYKRRAKAS